MLVLLFYIGTEMYACNTEFVIEVLPKVHLKKTLHVPEYIVGYMNYGNMPVPVIDLCQYFENRSSSNSMHTRILLLKNPNPHEAKHFLGLIAEKITEIIEKESSDFMDSGLQVKNSAHFGGVLNYNKSAVQFIHIEKFFSLLDVVNT